MFTDAGKTSMVLLAAIATCALATPAALAGGPVANHEEPLPPALDAPEPEPTDGPIVQLALLLDTSNSMDGLIDQARSELWRVVNDLSGIRECCKPVQLQVALYQYGNDGLEASDGHVQLRVPFTTDLDIVSEQLFSLRTKGGQEYCGWAIRTAGEELEWIEPSDEPDAPSVLRLLVIAGNEPFSQGTVAYSSSIPTLVNRGVTIHTVFCGDHASGASTFWKDGATMGEGEYCSIDQNKAHIEIPTPFDKRITELNSRLNATYIAYGQRGHASDRRQAAQDSATGGGSIFAERARAKASALYRNASWDLVDALDEDAVELEEVDRSTLPSKFRDMSDEQLAEAVREMREKRDAIQAELRKTVAERGEFVAENGPSRENTETLGSALIEAIRRTATAKGFIEQGEQAPGE